MTTVRLRLPKEHVDRLSVIAKRQGVSIGVLIHETIMNLIERDKPDTEIEDEKPNR